MYSVIYLEKPPARFGLNVPSGIYNLPGGTEVTVPEDAARELQLMNSEGPIPKFIVREIPVSDEVRIIEKARKITTKAEDLEQAPIVKKKKVKRDDVIGRPRRV